MPRLQARLLRYSQTLEMLWGSLGVALGWLWGSLGVALGWLWGAYAVPINRPWGGLGVALGGFAQPPFWFQLSAFSISAFSISIPNTAPLPHLPGVVWYYSGSLRVASGRDMKLQSSLLNMDSS